MTSSQLNLLKGTTTIQWLMARKDTLLHQDTIEEKIREGFCSVGMENRTTRTNIAAVARHIGIDWGNTYTPPTVVHFNVATGAVSSLQNMRDAKVAQAVRTAAGNPSGGRTAPGVSHVNHLHIGGDATSNLLYDNQTGMVLGILNFHMESGMSAGQRTQVQNMANRRSTASVAMHVKGNDIF